MTDLTEDVRLLEDCIEFLGPPRAPALRRVLDALREKDERLASERAKVVLETWLREGTIYRIAYKSSIRALLDSHDRLTRELREAQEKAEIQVEADQFTREAFGIVTAEVSDLRAKIEELYSIINDDGSLTTHEEHRDILRDAMSALNGLPAMQAALAAERERAERLEECVRRHHGPEPHEH